MEYRRLGRTGLEVSEIGLGGWQAGGKFSVGKTPLGWSGTSDQSTLEVIRTARRSGVTFFDTSDIYGFGRSESLFGIALAKYRQDVVLSTKVGFVRGTDDVDRDYSRTHILRAIDRSLRRLRTDYIDVYQLHNPPIEVLRNGEAQEALEMLQEVGKIRFWGVSVTKPAEGLEIIENNWGHTIQLLYNVLNQSAGVELLPAANAADYGIIARVPLASGLLSGRLRSDTTFPVDDVRQNFLTKKRLSEAIEWVDEVRAIVGPVSDTLTEAALRFVLANDAISTTVPGARTPHQVEVNCRASEARLPAEIVDKLIQRVGGYNFYERHEIRV